MGVATPATTFSPKSADEQEIAKKGLTKTTLTKNVCISNKYSEVSLESYEIYAIYPFAQHSNAKVIVGFLRLGCQTINPLRCHPEP